MRQLKHLVVAPALEAIGLGGDAAVNLVTGTAYVESDGVYLMQMPNGPALGLWQMEPATEKDCWKNFLEFDDNLANRVDLLLSHNASVYDGAGTDLIGNLPYAAAMCRIKYRRSPLPMPDATDSNGMAEYHKAIYNSVKGKANPIANALLFVKAITA